MRGDPAFWRYVDSTAELQRVRAFAEGGGWGVTCFGTLQFAADGIIRPSHSFYASPSAHPPGRPVPPQPRGADGLCHQHVQRPHHPHAGGARDGAVQDDDGTAVILHQGMVLGRGGPVGLLVLAIARLPYHSIQTPNNHPYITIINPPTPQAARYNIGGAEYVADDLENGILRGNRPAASSLGMLLGFPGLSRGPFGPGDARGRAVVADPIDPRIHFALVCGAKSCPPIKLYSADNLDEGLGGAAEAFVASDVKVCLRKGGGRGVDFRLDHRVQPRILLTRSNTTPKPQPQTVDRRRRAPRHPEQDLQVVRRRLWRRQGGAPAVPAALPGGRAAGGAGGAPGRRPRRRENHGRVLGVQLGPQRQRVTGGWWCCSCSWCRCNTGRCRSVGQQYRSQKSRPRSARSIRLNLVEVPGSLTDYENAHTFQHDKHQHL
jgi:hypothetical protein